MTTTDARAGTLADLLVPFPPEAIGKLPRSTCRACSDSARKRCDNHSWVSRCTECGGSHSSATMHLDYVGHADITRRLLDVDPKWSWEPFAVGQDGLPAVTGGNLWIRLTVLGVTRIGVGDGKTVKEAIGDALRNAAMRFGLALDLWAKGDRSWAHAEDQTPQNHQPPPPDDPKEALRRLCVEHGMDLGKVGADFAAQYGTTIPQASPEQVAEFTTALRAQL